MSRNIPSAMKAIFEVCASNLLAEEYTHDIEAVVRTGSMVAIVDYGDDKGAISPDMVCAASRGEDIMLNTL